MYQLNFQIPRSYCHTSFTNNFHAGTLWKSNSSVHRLGTENSNQAFCLPCIQNSCIQPPTYVVGHVNLSMFDYLSLNSIYTAPMALLAWYTAASSANVNIHYGLPPGRQDEWREPRLNTTAIWSLDHIGISFMFCDKAIYWRVCKVLVR